MLNEDTRLLLARCRRGDAEAQSELLARYSRVSISTA